MTGEKRGSPREPIGKGNPDCPLSAQLLAAPSCQRQWAGIGRPPAEAGGRNGKKKRQSKKLSPKLPFCYSRMISPPC